MEKINEEIAIKIWNKAYSKYEEIINRHHISDCYTEPESIKLFKYDEVAQKMALHLQNGYNKGKIIKFHNKRGGNETRIMEILKDQYYHNIKNKTKEETIEELKCIVHKEFDMKNSEKTWDQYIEGNVDFMYLYKENPNCVSALIKNINQLYEEDKFDDIYDEVYKFQKNIKGIHIALACDFLKESGCNSLGKPDTHMIDVFKTIRQVDKIDQKQCLLDLLAMAKLVKKTPYYVDKVFYLLCTGNFYKEDLLCYRKADLLEEIEKINL